MRRPSVPFRRGQHHSRLKQRGRRSPLRPLLLSLCAVFALFVAGNLLAGHEAAGSSTEILPGTGSSAITYQPNTRIIERDEAMSALKAVSSDGSTLLFETKNPLLQSLKVNDILLIKGLAVKKVLAVQAQGSEIAVLTTDASLGEAIRQGSIHVDAPISFTTASRAQLVSPAPGWQQLIMPTAYAQSPDSEGIQKAQKQGQKDAAAGLVKSVISGVFEGWETNFSATPTNGRLNISIKLTKDIGGFRAIITGEGYLADFDLSSNIEVNQGVVQQLQVMHRKLNGVMNFKWEVAKDSPGEQTGDDRIKLPAAISIPLYQYLDGLPLFLEISAAVIIKPAISGGKEYSRGAFRITYDGDQSFQAKEGNIDSNGQVKGDIQFLESQNISALAPLGMVVGFAAPRIELSFGVSKIIKADQLESAAKKVDQIADQLIKRLLPEDDYQRFKSSPYNFKIGQAVENALKSDAAAFIEMVATSGMSHSGFSAIYPCTRTDLHLIIKVGASAQAFGQKIGETETDIFKKDFTRIDPPGTRQCEQIGQ